jgi:antibiotic biosynthesis monooxygenase (ABM) superfamily enzyme
MMIARIWHGWTIPQNADTYQRIVTTEVIPGIAAMKIPGYKDIQVLRRDTGDEVEFITVMRFDSLDSVRRFVGEDYEVAHVPAQARAVLSRFDNRSQHYEIVGEFRY